MKNTFGELSSSLEYNTYGERLSSLHSKTGEILSQYNKKLISKWNGIFKDICPLEENTDIIIQLLDPLLHSLFTKENISSGKLIGCINGGYSNETKDSIREKIRELSNRYDLLPTGKIINTYKSSQDKELLQSKRFPLGEGFSVQICNLNWGHQLPYIKLKFESSLYTLPGPISELFEIHNQKKMLLDDLLDNDFLKNTDANVNREYLDPSKFGKTLKSSIDLDAVASSSTYHSPDAVLFRYNVRHAAKSESVPMNGWHLCFNDHVFTDESRGIERTFYLGKGDFGETNDSIVTQSKTNLKNNFTQ